MPRLKPLTVDQLAPDLRSVMTDAEKMMGFSPNDGLTMARHPALMKSLSMMVQALYGSGTVEPELKRLIGNITSTAGGCHYCQAHTAHGAHSIGVSREKIDAIWTYETSPLFSDRERVALRVAHGAGLSPSAVTDDQFNQLSDFFSEDEIVEIVGVISLFGFLNRWNATIATEIESLPLAFARKR